MVLEALGYKINGPTSNTRKLAKYLAYEVKQFRNSTVEVGISHCSNRDMHRLYAREVDQSSHVNQLLGIGIGVFQGFSNIALNGWCKPYSWLLYVNQ